MYKFVKEEKINTMEKEIEKLQKELESKNMEIVYLKSEKNDVQNTNRTLNERVRELYKSNSTLIAGNNYLVEWVKSVIHDLGTYKVDDKKRVTIPTYTREDIRAYDANESNPQYLHTTKEIVVPEIRFVEMR